MEKSGNYVPHNTTLIRNNITDGDSLEEEKRELLFHEVILTLILVALGFTKILYFIRIFEDFGLLVQVIGETIVEIIPFAVYYIIWILFFAVMFLVL